MSIFQNKNLMLFSLFLLLLLYACGGSDESNTVNPAANTPLNDPVNDLETLSSSSFLEIVEISSQSSTGASYINSYATLCSMLPCNEYGNGNNYLLGDTRYVCLQEGNTNQWSWQMLFSSLDELELLQPCNETLYRRKAILDDVKSTYKCMPDVFGTWKWQRSFYMVEDLAVQPCDESNDGEIVLLYDIYNRCMADASNLNWNWTLFLTSYNETLQTYPCSDSRVYNRIAYFVAEDAYSICSADASGLWNWSGLIKKETPEIVEVESSSSAVVSVVDYLTDSRDGQVYQTVKIGDQVWMAKNLNYETPDSYGGLQCASYGRFYPWTVAVTVCPDGWHLPTKAEFEILLNFVGGVNVAGKMLKSVDGWQFYKDAFGVDEYGFAALPEGHCEEDVDGIRLTHDGSYAEFWSSSVVDDAEGYYLQLRSDRSAASFGKMYVGEGLSVRCIKD